MSDYRAIAAITATLRNLLQDAVRAVPGATVRAGRPDKELAQAAPAGVINLFLYQAHPNPSFRNAELPVRRADGSLIRPPQLALDLHYLLTFYGDDGRHIPHLLLGLAMSALHAAPYPSPAFIPTPSPEAVDEALDVGRSGLVDQAALLRVVPLSMTHDELSKLWSIFFQVPYALSIAYRCSVILIEPDLMPRRLALPVREPRLGAVRPALPPHLDEVSPQRLSWEPGAELRLRGRGVAGDGTVARFGDLESQPRPIDPATVAVPLPDGLRAGVRTVRLAQEGVESNPLAFVLQPRVIPEGVELRPPGPGPHAAGEPVPTLVLRVEPAIGPGQRVRVLLNELVAEPGGPGRLGDGMSFALPPAAAVTPTLELPVAEAPPGTYLVRVEVDGVGSVPETAGDPGSPRFGRYDRPRVTIA